MLVPILTLTNLASTSLLLKALYKARRLRKIRKGEGLWKPWPIPKVHMEEFDALFAKSHRGPKRETEIVFFCNDNVVGGISDIETWFLCNLAKRASRIFEFGTCTGKTTYLLAKNTSQDAKISTLTLHPEQVQRSKNACGDTKKGAQNIAKESHFSSFYYSGTPEEKKITQYFQDSKEFDETPYIGSCDLIFIDGAHTYSYVMNDSAKAFKMIRPGGIILWHDYRGKYKTLGVFQALNELSKHYPLMHIDGTCLVAYRHPNMPL